MGCSCCTTSVADGNITKSEHDAKVYNLQCRYKDFVAKVTNKWRYGIFCPEDSETLIEIRALLRLLICYGLESEDIPGDDSQIPECYNDYVAFNGTDLNTLSNLPTGIGTGQYFFITSPYTGNYYILQSTQGYYSGDQVLPLSVLIYALDEGTPIIFGAPGTQGTFFVMDTLCSGNQADLDDALIAAQGVTVFSQGLPNSDLLKIVERIEKLLECLH